MGGYSGLGQRDDGVYSRVVQGEGKGRLGSRDI